MLHGIWAGIFEGLPHPNHICPIRSGIKRMLQAPTVKKCHLKGPRSFLCCLTCSLKDNSPEVRLALTLLAVMVCRNDLGGQGEELMIRYGQINEGIAHSCIMGGERGSEGTLPTPQVLRL